MATKTERRAFHVRATIGYVRRQLVEAAREGRPQDYVTRDGMPVSFADALSILGQMQDDGMEYVPCCDNCDEKGACQGFHR